MNLTDSPAEHLVPDDVGLRKFGLTLAMAFTVLLFLFLPWLGDFARPWFALAPIVGLAVIALAVPRFLSRLYIGWMQLADLLHKVVSPMVLGIVYVMVVVPTGFAMRALAKRTVMTKPDSSLKTYRCISEPLASNHLDRPF